MPAAVGSRDARAASSEVPPTDRHDESDLAAGGARDNATAALSPPEPPGRLKREQRLIKPEPAAEVLTLFLEAALAERNWPEAQRRAWQLYLTQFPDKAPKPQTWTAAHRQLRQTGSDGELTPEARVGIARALCRHPHLEQEPDLVRVAVDLCLATMTRKIAAGPAGRRSYQASCLLLAYLLPRLSHFDDFQYLVHRLPGLREKSPEYIASLHYFTENLGRQGGKLQYLLHTLEDRQETHPVRSPGDLVYLGALASELGQKRKAVRYFDQARRLRPLDQRLGSLRLQALLAANDAGRALQTLDGQPQNPETSLEMGKIYLQRHQYEGAIAMLEGIPQNHSTWTQAQMLIIQAQRGRQEYAAALAVISGLESRGERTPAVLMAKGQMLEAMNDRAGTLAAYEAVSAQAPNTPAAQAARARAARFRGDWAGAYRHFAAALRDTPQDIELLNELEQVREQMRPTLAGRNLPEAWRGERRPEEAMRPWQFGRYDREPGPGGGWQNAARSLLPGGLPYVLTPETTILEDHNRIKSLQTRLGGAFWLSRVLPVHLSLGYRIYRQDTIGSGPANLNLGLQPVFGQFSRNRTTWQRAEAEVALGPLVLGDKVKISGGLSGRRYWKELKQQVTQSGQIAIPFPPVRLNTLGGADLAEGESRNRLLGSLALGLAPGPKTDLTLRYSRSDIFDQDPAIYPRLHQQVIRLDTLPLVTLDQAQLAASHQVFPGLTYQGNISQTWFSDRNQRFSLYQGLRWQAVDQPRMHLSVSPGYYLALYRRTNPSYFSPHDYHALELCLDFDRQLFQLPILSQPFSEAHWLPGLFRLSTLVVQTTVQMVANDGRWGPALATMAGLEAEPIQNLYVGLHYFYFKEWVSRYWLQSLTFGLRWRF